MKVAIVTGASRGIGKELALRLSEKGFFVCVNYMKDIEGAKSVLSLISESGGSGMIFGADVRIFSEVDRMFKSAAEYGTPEILVCNAGIAYIGLLQDMSDGDIREIIDTDLIGTINCCRAVIPYMLDIHRGKIVNISSIWGVCGGSCETVYSAAKAGVIGFSKALSKELGPSGITVNCVSPGVIDTEMNRGLDYDSLAKETPIGRIGTASEIADTVAFLVENGFITGQNIIADGGFIS